MADSLPIDTPYPAMTEAASEPPTSKSSAIYTSAERICKLIEDETAFAIKPYQEALEALQQQLRTQAGTSVDQSAAAILTQSLQRAQHDLDAVRRILEENGMGLMMDAESGKGSLCYVGEREKVISNFNEEIRRFAPSPDESHPISPATIVHVLVHCFAQCKERLEEAHKTYSSLLTQRDELMKQVARRDTTIETAKTAHSELETSLKDAQAKVVALTEALAALRTGLQETAVKLVSVRAESDDWQTKYQTMETERDSLKTAIDAKNKELVSAHGNLSVWKAKHLAAETDLKTAKEESGGELGKLQSEVDEWKKKYLALEEDMKAAVDAIKSEKETLQSELRTQLAAIQSEADSWKTKALAADTERNTAQSALRDANTEALEVAETAKTDLAGWEAKAAAWETERSRHKSQIARNAALITQYRADIPKLEAKLRETETERDQLKEALQAENAQALAKTKAMASELEEMKKKLAAVAAGNSPKVPASIFINKPRAPATRPIPDKPAAPIPAAPQGPATTQASPMSAKPTSRRSFSTPSGSSPTAVPNPEPQTSSRVVGIQGGLPVRRNIPGNRGTPSGTAEASGSKVTPRKAAVQPRSPPVLVPNSTGGGEVLRGAPVLTRSNSRAQARDSPSASTLSSSSTLTTTPRASTSKRPADDATTSKRSALSSQSNTSLSSTPKAVSDGTRAASLKRSAPSPLVPEREKKILRSSSSTSAADPPSLRFTKPPTSIAIPGHPVAVPAPAPIPSRNLNIGTPPVSNRRIRKSA